jgi:hypothetical protein
MIYKVKELQSIRRMGYVKVAAQWTALVNVRVPCP